MEAGRHKRLGELSQAALPSHLECFSGQAFAHPGPWLNTQP